MHQGTERVFKGHKEEASLQVNVDLNDASFKETTLLEGKESTERIH